MHRIVSTLVLALALAGPALQAQSTWKADRSHSVIKFSVTHMMLSTVEGAFTDWEINFVSPRADDFSGSTVEATIQMESINTHNQGRDSHLKSEDFFDVTKYPTMTFKSSSFEKTGEKTYKIVGDLTLRGVTKPVTLDTKLTGQIIDQRGNPRIGFKATTTINRFDYGVKWDRSFSPGNLVASEDVEITLFMEFIQPKIEPKKEDVTKQEEKKEEGKKE